MRRATRTVVLAAVAAGLTLLPASMTISLYGSALAAKTANTSKSNNYKVTGVDAKAKTFTAVAKDGKQFTFAVPKGKALPTVGKFYAITYTESPGGGPLNATTIKTSKSNSY